MREPCAICAAPAVWVRDDDVPHCQPCRDDDQTGLLWWPAPSVRALVRRPRPDFDPRVDYPERFSDGPY